MRKYTFTICAFSFMLLFFIPTSCSKPNPSKELSQNEPSKKEGQKGKEGISPSDGSFSDGTIKDSGTGKEALSEEKIKLPEPNPNTGKARWSEQILGKVKSMALSKDEKELYVSASGLTVLNAKTGDELWAISNPRYGRVFSAPAIGPKGMIYVGTDKKLLLAIDPRSKRVEWSFTLAGEADKQPPAVSKDGTIYIIGGNHLHAIKDRVSVWKKNYSSPKGFDSAPTVARDGTIYLCGLDKQLHAVKKDGSSKWTKSMGKEACRNPAIDSDGTLYVGADKLYSFKPNGSVKWAPVGKYGVINTAIVIHGQYLYFGTFRGKIFKVNKATGKAVFGPWEDGHSLSTVGSVRFAPTIGAGGVIYLGHDGLAIEAIRPDRPKTLFSLGSRSPFSGYPTIAKDGTLYVGCEDGTVFAIWTDSPGLARSPWPRGLQNNQNTSFAP